MNLFKVLPERIEDLGLSEELTVFVEALTSRKDDEEIQEIIHLCDTNYFYVNFDKADNDDKYDVGKLIIEFDDESRHHELSYIINLTYISCKNTYLPKITIEKREFVKGFIFNEL